MVTILRLCLHPPETQIMAAEDINKAIRDTRHVKSSRDEDHGDRFLNEFVEFTSNNLSP